VLNNTEKVDYIKKHFGDTEDLVIMYNYKAELTKLSAHFKKAKLLQGTSYAEGVDLSMHKHLVVYSQDFSTARHTQRRARQANMNRKEPITVHFLLVKKAISEEVYKTVSINKKNYVDSVFSGDTL
jgi:ERCC4-related helicase